MRLVELDPRWFGIDRQRQWAEEGPGIRFGLTFLCPHCKDIRIGVCFKPFIDPDNLAWKIQWAWPGAANPNDGSVKAVLFWQRAGETFETLTLVPSIDASQTGHWHGFITNGEVT